MWFFFKFTLVHIYLVAKPIVKLTPLHNYSLFFYSFSNRLDSIDSSCPDHFVYQTCHLRRFFVCQTFRSRIAFLFCQTYRCSTEISLFCQTFRYSTLLFCQTSRYSSSLISYLYLSHLKS